MLWERKLWGPTVRKKFGKKVKPEEKLALACADFLRMCAFDNVFWLHVANEAPARSRAHVYFLKAMGFLSGAPDIFIIRPQSLCSFPDHWGPCVVLLVELKSPKGSLSNNQKRVRDWCVDHGLVYRVIRDLDSFKRLCLEYGMAE